MSDKIVENQEEIEYPELGTTYYAKKENLKVHRFHGTIYITDVTDALRTGKTCENYSMHFRCAYDNEAEAVSQFLVDFDYDYKNIFDYLGGLEWTQGKWGGYEGIVLVDTIGNEYTVYKGAEKAIRVFSPFNLKYLKPLKETPKKWTVRHVLRLIINGQYKDLNSNLKLTDDYAYDNAVNFGKGAIADGIDFAKSIIESPSGWWVGNYEGEDKLSFNCHHFDYNSLIPVIK